MTDTPQDLIHTWHIRAQYYNRRARVEKCKLKRSVYELLEVTYYSNARALQRSLSSARSHPSKHNRAIDT